MSKRNPGRSSQPSSPGRSKTSILSIAFAGAMAFFLVIGMVAVALPEFMGGGDDDQTVDFDSQSSIAEQSESEEQELRDRLEENPEDDSAMAQLAVFLSNTGRMNESIEWYEKALDHREDDTELRISFARTLRQQGYDLDAEVQLDRVLEEDPGNAEAMFLKAEILEQKDPPRQDEADALYEQIVEDAPDSVYAGRAEERLADEPDSGEEQEQE